jgi:hypothetical protein
MIKAERDRIRYQKNKDIISHRSTRIRTKNRIELNLYHWKRLASRHQLNGEELQKQFLTQEKRCFYCKVIFDEKNIPSVEHYFPGDNSKIVISCIYCNRLKWDKDGDNFILFLKEYVSRFKE